MSNTVKKRADILLFEQGLVRSRRVATDLILSGDVSVGGIAVKKPSQEFEIGTVFEVKNAPRFVGRGGDKLQIALTHFDITVKDAVVLDIGASTGGFTDCVLQNGAKKIYAVDVGTGQLDASLRMSPYVVSMEGVDIRTIAMLPEKASLCVVDVSFISLTHVIPVIPRFLAPGARGIFLVKPQFEVGRELLPKDGVVKSDTDRLHTLEKVKKALIEHGFTVKGEMDCPTVGQSGNREFLLSVVYNG